MVACRLPRLGSIVRVIVPDFIINLRASTLLRTKALLGSEFRISLARIGSVGSSASSSSTSAGRGSVSPLVSSLSSSART